MYLLKIVQAKNLKSSQWFLWGSKGRLLHLSLTSGSCWQFLVFLTWWICHPSIFLHLYMTLPSANMSSPFVLLYYKDQLWIEDGFILRWNIILAKMFLHIHKYKGLGLVCVSHMVCVGRTQLLAFSVFSHHSQESSMVLNGAWFPC